MPNTLSTSMPIKGMVTDLHPINTDGQAYSFALNALVSDRFLGNQFLLQNENSNTCSVEFPPNYQVVGFKEIPELNRVIYFLTNILNGNNQIGEVINCTYTESTDKVQKSNCQDCPGYFGEETIPFEKRQENCYCLYRMIVTAPCLGFNVHYPVDIEYKITDCNLQLYFTDNLGERRFLYLKFQNNDLTNPLELHDNFKVWEYVDEGCDCPEGYTYDPLQELCIRVTNSPITVSGDTRVACAATDIVYGNFGVALYSSFALNGTGTSTTMHAADTFWSNPGSNTVDGRLNFSGLWPCTAGGSPQPSPMLPLNENVGFLFGLNVPVTKTYYVGIAGDNKVRIRVDCNTVMDMDANALDVQYGGTGNAFKYWHIYPITLTAGRHVIEVTGVNFGSVAGFGAEIYDNTPAEIAAAVGGAGLNILFSTHDSRGQLMQVSTSYSGTCAEGQCVSLDENDNLVCTLVETAAADCHECEEYIIQDELDCNKTKIHPEFTKPCITLEGFVNGGNLAAGTYQVMLAYADVYGNELTNYFSSTQPISLFIEPITFETNYITPKALKINISNLKTDSLYQYYNLVVAKTVDNFTEFIKVGTFSTTQTEYVYTGFEKAPIRLSPEQVFFRYPFYKTAKGVTKANNYLFFTGVKEYDLLNLQRVANSVKLYWQTVALKENAYLEAKNTNKYRSYMRDEVYAMGIVFVFKNGRESCVFHIPGRESVPTDLEIVATNDVISNSTCEELDLNQRWQVYNTGSVLGGDYEYNDNCDDIKCWEYGEFSYWESTETYPKIPEIWGDLCGQPIRHHKFPDSCVTHIHDGLNGTKTFADNNYIFPIGVRIDHQSVIDSLDQAVVDGIITQAQKDDIVGYRIVRGNRVGNKSIDAKGLLYNMWSYNKYSNDYYYANYPYNDLRDDNFLAPDDSTYDGSTTSDPTPSEYYGGHDRFTFHSPDIHFVNTGLGNILKVETEEYGESEGYFTLSDCQARHKFLSTAARSIALGFGVAAALSATGEKECKVITKKADQITTGTMPIPNVAQATYTLTNGTGVVPPITTTPSTGSVNTTINNNTGIYTTYDPDTGLPIGVPINGSEESITTCKGQAYQLFNANVIVNTILVAGGAGLGLVIQKVLLGIMEAEKIVETFKTLIPYKNYSTQYNSVGKYNNYRCTAVGNKRRLIEKSAYLEPIIQSIDEPSANPTVPFTTIKVNNWNRERSVYIKIPTGNPLAAPFNVDNSRFTMDEASLNYEDLNKNVYRDISSYYVSIKRTVLNQYGQLCNIEYLETNGCEFFLDGTYTPCQTTVFGGDTFINRFALKRKMPFFLHTMCGMPDGSDVLYSELGNVAFPNYYFDTEKPFFQRFDSITSIGSFFSGATLQDIIGTNDTRLDAKTSKFFYQNGYAHLFSYGVPYFFVESDINVDMRHGQNNKEKDFYPHNSDLKTWFQEDYVPIKEDNYYFYNRTYSKQNKENALCVSCIRSLDELYCQNNNDNRLIYSEPSDTEVKNDNWLIFKANNYYDFPLTLGKLITADGIENDKVLVRFEKGTQIFSAYNTIQATEENIQVGTGGLFQSRPKDIAVTDLGYAGTQHKDILHTEYGHIWGNAESGQIFNLMTGGSGIEELTKDGMSSWFRENLPFQIRKDFPNIKIEDIDNNLNGLGLHYCFDRRFNRFLITKLDYKKINDAVQYNTTTKEFYILVDEQPVTVKLTDKKYFCDKSWTVSYNFYTKSWVSYHTYTPEFYVENLSTFDSSNRRLGLQKLYTHNATNKSYQVFYNKLQPFIVELQPNQSIVNNYLTNISYILDVIRYHNEFDTFYVNNVTFNKAIVYNDRQCSGLLTFKVSNPENLFESIDYPKRISSGLEVLTTNSENVWNFNDFYDVVSSQTNNLPIFNYDCNNVNKQLNVKNLNYAKGDFDKPLIRQRMCKIRLINDAESQYKFILNLGLINQYQSIR